MSIIHTPFESTAICLTGLCVNFLWYLLFTDIRFIVIDSPGHGKSSNFPAGMMYEIQKYVTSVHYFVKGMLNIMHQVSVIIILYKIELYCLL